MALRNNFQSRVFLSFMKQISGVFSLKYDSCCYLDIKKTYVTQLTSFIQRVPHLPKTALPFRTNGPHRLDLKLRSCFNGGFSVSKSVSQKTIWGRMFWLLGPKKNRNFLSILSFFTDLRLIDHFLRFQSIPEEKWLPFSRAFRFPRPDSPETLVRDGATVVRRIRCPRLLVQLFGSSSDDISQLPGDLMAGTTWKLDVLKLMIHPECLIILEGFKCNTM